MTANKRQSFQDRQAATKSAGDRVRAVYAAKRAAGMSGKALAYTDRDRKGSIDDLLKSYNVG